MTRLAFRLRIPLHHLVLGLALIVAVLPAVILSGQSRADSMTWDGGGTTNNWSDCANWSSDVCPGAGDTVIFNSTSTKDSVVDASFGGTITNLNINSGYTGTVSQGRDLNLSGNFNQVAGNFTAGSQTFTTNQFTLSGGSFTASSEMTNVSSNFTVTGSPTFNANGGTVNFDSSSNPTIACDNVTFNLVTLSSTAGTTTIGSDCDLPLGNNPSITSGALTINGILSGSGTLTKTTIGAIALNSGGTLSGFTGLVATSATLATSNGIYDFSNYTTLAVGPFAGGVGSVTTMPLTGASFNGTFVLNSGATFNASPATTSISGTFTLNSGSIFNANGGTVNFNNTSSINLTCNGAVFNLVTLNNGNSFLDIGSTCNLPLGNNPTTGRLTLDGTVSGSGTLTATGGNSNLNAGGAFSGFSGLSLSNTTINGNYDFSSYSSFSAGAFVVTGTAIMPHDATIGGALTLSAGSTLTASAGTIEVDGSLTINSGSTFNANGGTVDFGGTANATLSCNHVAFNLVTFTHTAGTKTVSGNCNLPLGNNPQAGNGGAISLNGTLSGTGTLTTDPGSGNNTLIITSVGTLSGFSGLYAHNLTLLNGPLDFNFDGYSTFQITGTLTVNSGVSLNVPDGADINNLALKASGSLNAPTGTMIIEGNATIDPAATFNANGGTVNFGGTGGTIACGNATFNLVTFSFTSGTKTVDSGCNLPLGNNPTAGVHGILLLLGTLSGSGIFNRPSQLTLGAGSALSGFTGLTGRTLTINGTYDFGNYTTFTVDSTFTINAGASVTMPAGIASFSDDFINNGGAFDANHGTVVLNGADQTISGDTAFYNLTKTATSDDSLTFVAGSTTTVTGTLTLHGDSSAYLSLASDTAGAPWYLDAQGATNVYSVDVSDSHVLGDSVTACTSVDDGGNSGWIFNPSSCNPDHGGSGANTAISNYVTLQAYLTNQQAQYGQAKNSQNQQQITMNGGLPDKIQQFIQEFPNSKAITAGLTDFLKAAAAGVSIGFLIGLGWWLWIILGRRRRKDHSNHPTPPPQATRIITPTIIAPTSAQTPPVESKKPEDEDNNEPQ